MEEIQQLNNVLNGFSAPDPIDVESLKERLMNLTQEVDFFLKLIDNQRLNVKQGAADISAYTWNPLVSVSFFVHFTAYRQMVCPEMFSHSVRQYPDSVSLLYLSSLQ